MSSRTKRGLRAAPLMLTLAAALALPTSAPAAPARVTLSGADSLLPLIADLAFFYNRAHPGAAEFSAVGGGTGAGINDVSRGVSQLGLAVRSRVPEDPVKVGFVPFARGAICIVTPLSHRLPGVTRSTITGLVSGAITSWAQVPGANAALPLAAAAYPVGYGARDVFLDHFVDASAPIAYTPIELDTPLSIRRYIAATPGAWGYAHLAFATGLHRVPVDGVACDAEHVSNGTYPARYDVSFVTSATTRQAARKFVRWVGRSAVAKKVIATRFMPLK